VSTDTTTDIGAAIEQLRTTFDSGRTLDLDWRRRQLKGVIELVRTHEDELLAALESDLGKPAFDGWLTELLITRDEAAHALKHLGSWTKPSRVAVPVAFQPGSARTEPQPLGVVLLISPWNYPFQLLMAPLVAALAAGNCVLLKPSELAPATSAAVARLVPRYLDPEAVTVVEGGVPVTTELLTHPWDHILFTGSTRVGQVVMEAAAKHLTPVTLELGGKSPTIVAADADIGVAARRIAWAKVLNAGQTCIAPDYVLVERSVSEQFTGLVVDELAKFRDKAPATSIVNEHHLDRLEGLLDGHGGEELLPRKTDRASRAMAPVVIREPDTASDVMNEEIFGPILPVLAVDSIDDAISFVKARPRPLALYLFSGSKATERKVLDRTHAGSVCINHLVYQAAVPELPFGGVGPSGMGAYHGKAGFDTFTHHKAVLTKPTRLDPGFMYPPYSGLVQKILKFATRW
jgi:aldehyde dehydrogenase (NAD+)